MQHAGRADPRAERRCRGVLHLTRQHHCPEGRRYHAGAACCGASDDPAPVLRRVFEHGLAGFVAHNFRTVVVHDITTNPLWLPLPDEASSPTKGSALCVPLIHSGQVAGVMTLAHPEHGYFTPAVVSFATTLAEMGAAALTYTQLLEAARLSQSRYASLFDDAIVPIIITDLHGNIQQVNRRACEFLDYSREELIARNITAVHRMGTGPIGADRFAHLERGLEVRFQSVVWTKDGSSKPVQVYARRINSGHDDDRIQWIEHDMTSQVALEQLRQDLSMMVYHDMRGPLGNVYTSLQAVKTLLGDDADENVKNLLRLASQAEQQVRRMVDALLDVQRLEQGARIISREHTGLSLLINRAVNQVVMQAEDKSIRLRMSLSDDVPLLYIDNNMIERVIVNLLDNAIKYTPEGGIVTLSTTMGTNEVRVSVKDTGPGIRPRRKPSSSISSPALSSVTCPTARASAWPSAGWPSRLTAGASGSRAGRGRFHLYLRPAAGRPGPGAACRRLQGIVVTLWTPPTAQEEV